MFLLILFQTVLTSHQFHSLHSSMFLLILFVIFLDCVSNAPLHSSMFLLIHYVQLWDEKYNYTLHSSMFLLIPVAHTCLYFNTLQCHFCLPKQLSTYSFTTSPRTTVSALIFRTVDLYYFLHYYKSTVTT